MNSKIFIDDYNSPSPFNASYESSCDSESAKFDAAELEIDKDVCEFYYNPKTHEIINYHNKLNRHINDLNFYYDESKKYSTVCDNIDFKINCINSSILTCYIKTLKYPITKAFKQQQPLKYNQLINMMYDRVMNLKN